MIGPVQQQHVGMDHTMHSYVAEVRPFTGRPVSGNEDEPHKLKDAVQGIQSQPTPSTADLDGLVAEIQAHNANCEAFGNWVAMDPRQSELV